MNYLFILIFSLFLNLNFIFAQTTELCSTINNQLVVIGSQSFFGKKCVLYPIVDSNVYNDLIVSEHLNPVEISEKQFSEIPLGEVYTPVLYMKDFNRNTRLVSSMCEQYSQKIVSSNNVDFYYIENCKKRKFIKYADLEDFTAQNSFLAVIKAISEYELNQIQTGSNMVVKNLPSNIGKTDREIAANLPSALLACQEVSKKAKTSIVTYYASFFYFQNCLLHPIQDLTIETMRYADKNGGIYELSTAEFLALPQGTIWKKMK